MKKLILVVFVTGISLLGFGQPNMELGLSGGFMYYIGDLNPTGHLQPDMMNLSYGVFHKGNFNGRWGIKTQIAIGSVNASDNLSDDPIQQIRNLDFQSDIYELTSVVEFNFLEFSNFNSSEVFSPCIYGGLGAFLMNPQTNYQNNLYDLRFYNTEGQAEPYNRFQLAFPFGIGLKVKPLERLTFFVDWGMRRTFTDYLDDVSTYYPDPNNISSITAALSNKATNSQNAINNNWETQRGNSKTNDWYSYLSFGLSFRLTNDPSNCHFNPY